jgi:hypothetical protein
MHVSREENLRFKIAFTWTNIRFLRDVRPVNQPLIDSHLESIRQAEAELEQLK